MQTCPADGMNGFANSVPCRHVQLMVMTTHSVSVFVKCRVGKTHNNTVQCTVCTIEKVYYVDGPSPVQFRLCGRSYLIKFSIRNLSYSPCSEPSHTVLLPG